MKDNQPCRNSTRMALLAALLAGLTTEGRAAVPMCDEVQKDPSIATCSCICDGDVKSTSTSTFAGCAGLYGGTTAPTPGSCPDMLQGRRVLSAVDALLATDPAPQNTDTRAATLLFAAENDATNPGLGTIDGDPSGKRGRSHLR